MTHAWRQRTEPKVSPEWSSDPCLAAADRTRLQSGAEPRPGPCGSGIKQCSVKSEAVAHAWRQRTKPRVCQEKSSGPSMAAADRTEIMSGAEQWPMPGGSGQGHMSVRSEAVAHAWRQRTKPQVSQERSSDPCMAAANRTTSQSGAEQWLMPGGSGQNQKSVRC